MYNDYSPSWEGQIGIAFTREEWLSIKGCLEYTINYSVVDYPDECQMELNIIDRIEKNLGIE